MAPLDATHLHGLTLTLYGAVSELALKAGSPLASFLDAVLQRTFLKLRSLVARGRESEVLELHMHDPLCVYYAMLSEDERADWVLEEGADVRVECAGTWTRGMTVLDQRVRGARPHEKRRRTEKSDEDDLEKGEDTMQEGDYADVDDDEGGWRNGKGNKVGIIWDSSFEDGRNTKTVETMAQLLWVLE